MAKKSLLFISLFFTVNSFAMEKISFTEAIDLAVKNNLEVKASYEVFKASQLDKKSTRSAFFPKISASLN